MIFVLIRMKVLSEKRIEFSQTIASLSGSIRMEEGCRRCDFCRSVEDDHRFFLLEEWDNQENLMTHLRSKHFQVLRGSMNLLREPYEMVFYTVFQPEGMEEVDRGTDGRAPEKDHYEIKSFGSHKSKF